MDEVKVKHEGIENLKPRESSRNPEPSKPIYVIDLSSTDSDSDESSSSSDDDCSVSGINGKRSRVSTGAEGGLSKKRKEKKNMEELGVPLPAGFLDPLPAKRAPSSPLSAARKPQSAFALNASENVTLNANANANVEKCKQFWKSGDYEGLAGGDWDTSSGGMDHVRVHPKFLHSNATSHKWVLGAFAELLDNSLDEVCNGATFVNMDMLENKKDGSRMLLIEDNGGGMDPDKMRQCMSLGYSVKSKIANTIGQYGNGFKTSTMRLGADVIVFSRCCGRDGKRPTQSIGLLSYTFLRSTWKEDILVPMLDYERGGLEWNRMIRSSASDWNINVQTMLQWSPFSSEVDLLRQFNQMKDHGTRIIIYNLWEDDKGQLELDFDTDPYDIQIRGANRDEKNIQMAKQYPNSKHFLTYKHSLRSYASILYIRIPAHFRIILRGKDVEHHNVVNDMMMSQEITYRPQPDTDGVPKDSHMFAVVTIGFVKDAKAHINVQGFNVYHKNRLIKPFWRVWNAAGSGGRGIIGVLEANFVEPAHDKQGFERTIVLSRLEIKLIQMQKSYWMKYCHKIGYVSWCKKNHIDERGMPPDYIPRMPSPSKTKNTGSSSEIPLSVSDKFHSHSNWKQGTRKSKRYLRTVDKTHVNGHACTEGGNRTKIPAKSGKGSSSSETSDEDVSNNEMQTALPERRADGVSQKALPADKPSWKDEFRGSRSFQNIRNTEAEQDCALKGRPVQSTMRLQSTEDDVGRSEFSPSNSNLISLAQLKEEKRQLRERLKRKEEDILGDIMRDLQHERDRCQSLENKLKEALLKIEELNKEQENLIDIFAEERQRRDTKEENLRKKLKDASNSIQELLDKVRLLEKKSPSSN